MIELGENVGATSRERIQKVDVVTVGASPAGLTASYLLTMPNRSGGGLPR